MGVFIMMIMIMEQYRSTLQAMMIFHQASQQIFFVSYLFALVSSDCHDYHRFRRC